MEETRVIPTYLYHRSIENLMFASVELTLSSPKQIKLRTSVGSIFVKLERRDLKSNVEVEIDRVTQAVQDVHLERSSTSSAVERLDEARRLSSGSDLLKSLEALVSKFDPIAKVIDDVSLVSR